MLAGAGTAPAAARVREPGVVAPSPAPMNLPAGPMAMDQPETSAASGPSSESALRVSSDSATPPARTWFPLEGLYPPDLPITSSFVKNGPAVAVAVLETVKPSVPVEGPDLRIVTAGAGRDAAGRTGAGPVFQQAGITSYDITLKPGSNLISLTLMPDDTAIEAVLAGILDRVETVWQYDISGPDPKWRSYAPGAPSDLSVMRDGPGYWVHLKHDVAGDAVLTVPGREATGPARRVVQGWNLVGFTATTAGDAATDRAALVALYNATDGANWRNNGNWLSNAPMGEWHGVTTDFDGRVTHLALTNNQLSGGIPAELGDLANLTQLFLHNNQLTGEIPAEFLSYNQLTGEIPAELGSLTNLKGLNLNNNQLTGGIPAELGDLANLTQLFLHNNQLTGGIPAELGSLTNLKGLDLSFNQLTGEIPAWLGSLTYLTELFLSYNDLTGEIPAELGSLTNLKGLDLSFNQLTGEISVELGSLTNLEGLYLYSNQLTGEIPAELGSLPNLKYLWLQGNQLTGEIPAELGSLPSLVRLFLSNNQLTGEIPAELGSLTNLVRLFLSNNQLTGEIPAELGSLTSLEYLSLSNNQLTGEIPEELGGLANLTELFLGYNDLSGEIPAELGSLTNLEWLYLNDNQLSGGIPAELGSLTNLIALYLDSNQLTGCIPGGLRDVPLNDLAQLGLDYCMPAASAGDAATDRAALVALYNATDGANWHNNGNWLSNATMGEWHGVTTDSDGRVTHLDLRHNQLTGEIPAELGNLSNLTELFLNSNQLTGSIPAELGSLTNLERLRLTSNQLTGEIPAELGNLTSLEWLYLFSNQLTGEIPAELGSLTNLTHLLLTNNQLTGSIPAELGSLTNLEWLRLTSNQLTGEIPVELGNLTNLTDLDLFSNQLTGGIPVELGNLTNLTDLSLDRNQLTGGIPAELGDLTSLEDLDLSNNQLTGEIPAELGDLTNLEDLDLSNNQLTGEIPAWLGDLTSLEDLDLSNNQLTGEIPAGLGSLDLNDNQLTGEIPAGLGSLAGLEELFLGGNGLTGCIPNGLRGVGINDLSQLGLPFCDMPGAPTIATPIVPGDASLTVAWAAPINTGSSAITAYDLRYIETGAADKSDANWTVVEDVWAAGSGSLQYTLSGLTGGTQYDVQVRAVNAAGASAWSSSAIGTPAWEAIRSFSPPSAALGGEVVVTVTASGYGPFGGIMETLPAGFSYVSSSLPDDSVTVNGQVVTFNLLGETDFTYTVAAPSAEGSYSFSGVLTNSDRAEVPVGGAITIAVAAGAPLIVRYDANGNGMIEKGRGHSGHKRLPLW